MGYAVEVSGMKKYFKEIKAVDDISFQVEKGELFGFLGINGAGKSTTINMLCTLFPATAGQARICGHALGKEDDMIRRKIGVVWQGNCLDKKLTVKENLYVRGSLYGLGKRQLRENVENICERLGLSDIFGRRYEHLSGGQKRRCEIAAALVNMPEVLFLDEPTTGLDPATRQLVWNNLEEMREKEGVTIFLTTHYMEEAAKANHIAVIDSGKIRETGTPFGLKERFARDKLKLIPVSGREEELECILKRSRHKGNGDKNGSEGNCGERYTETITWKEGYFLMTLPESMSALPILKAAEKCLQGFELAQGSMDDVFLNITGKALEKMNGQTQRP